MKSFAFLCALLLIGSLLWGQPETEPNNGFATANTVAEGATVSGTIGDTGDAFDYFLTVPNDDGTINLQFSFNSTGSSFNDIIVNVYNKQQGSIGSKTVANTTNGNDSILIYCRAADTIYIRFTSVGIYTYQFSYQTVPSRSPDAEPNDNFGTAVDFAQTDTMKGRVGYTSIATDNLDYYRTVLPDDGTLIFYVKVNNVSNSTFSDFTSIVYNKGQSQIGSSSRLSNVPLGISYDTLRVYCRAADTVFFRINSVGCFSYEFHYEVIPSGTRDAEPNNSFASAVDFVQTDTVKGRIGYTSVGTDNLDYFRTVLPDDGTLIFYVKVNNVSNSIFSDFTNNVYNKGQGQIGSSTRLSNAPLGISYDTVRVYCRAADTVYFRVNSVGLLQL
jgi:Tfp pilus assembly protein PilX